MAHAKKIQRNYVSEIDQYLQLVTKQQIPSKSQQKEIAKHQRIAQLRDDANSLDAAQNVWDEFSE